jgi:hypothetical protein
MDLTNLKIFPIQTLHVMSQNVCGHVDKEGSWLNVKLTNGESTKQPR